MTRPLSQSEEAVLLLGKAAVVLALTDSAPALWHEINDYLVALDAAQAYGRSDPDPTGQNAPGTATLDAARAAPLREALLKYGARHTADCRASNPNDECVCGLNAALASAEPSDD